WSAGLPCSPRNSYVEACTAARASWRPRSSAISRSPTRARSRSCGPRLPTRSSNRWLDFVDGLPTRDTRRTARSRAACKPRRSYRPERAVPCVVEGGRVPHEHVIVPGAIVGIAAAAGEDRALPEVDPARRIPVLAAAEDVVLPVEIAAGKGAGLFDHQRLPRDLVEMGLVQRGLYCGRTAWG